MVNSTPTDIPDDVKTRFWRKVDRAGPTDCWLWIGGKNPRGYGRFIYNNIGYSAHRFAYEMVISPIPAGLVSDHLCRNRSCVNPAHIEPVTNAENVRRGLAPELAKLRGAAVTHCVNGHEYTEENTIWDKRGPHKRKCRACQKRFRYACDVKRRAKQRELRDARK